MRAGEYNYSSLIENLPEALAYHRIITDSSGCPVNYIFLHVNKAFERIMGLPRHKVINRKATEIIPEIINSDFDWIKTFGTLALTGENPRFEYLFKLFGRHYRITAFAEGEGYFSIIFHDTIDKKEGKAEAAEETSRLHKAPDIHPKESERKYRQLFEESPISLWEEDFSQVKQRIEELRQDGITNFESYFQSNPILVKELAGLIKVKDVNQATLKLYKANTKEEFLSGITKVFTEKSYESFIATLTAVAEGRTEFFTEINQAALDGKILDVQLHWSVVPGYEKTYSRVLISIVDITRRKQAERKLTENKAWLEKYAEDFNTVLNNTQDVMYILDVENEETFYYRITNKKHQELTKLPSDKIQGKTPFEVLPQESAKTVVSKYRLCCRKKEPINYEITLALPRGESHWSCKLSPIIKKGTVIQLVGSAQDITKRKRAEEQLRYLCFYDQMTGIYNRRFLEEEIKRLDTERQLPISIIMADLNGLKLVNDTYGHNKGDKMLKSAAETLKNFCRKEDIIARWGGDEFVILLPQTELENAQNICKRIKEKSRGIYVDAISVSISLGTAVKSTADKTLIEVLQEAEDDMYKNKLTDNRSVKNAVLNALLTALEEKSFETEEHTRRMQNIALKIGQKLSLSDSELKRLELLITLHDIGKININEEILTKSSSLTEEEWKLIKKHPEVGYRIALATDEFAHVAEDILAHHERWDGKGYPQGLKADNIPLLARITAIADAYEVMSSGRRPYKKNPMSLEAITAEIKSCTGTQFDPELVDIFLDILEEYGCLL